MSTFDNESSIAGQPTPESFENKSHVITRNPIEIDLSQPDRAKDFSFEEITGFKESKLIAEIRTPVDDIAVIHTQFAGLDPVIMLVGKDREARVVLDPGEEIDLSAVVGEEKCIVSVGASGKHVFVFAHNPDKAYKIYTREKEQYKVPEAPSGDPES